MTGRNPFREYRNFVVLLVVMALLSPLGLYLPKILKAGSAWGEWGVDEIKGLIGYAPKGMDRTAGQWKAPMPDYGLPGATEGVLRHRGAAYVLSAFVGIALCGGGAWLLGRWLARRKGPPRP